MDWSLVEKQKWLLASLAIVFFLSLSPVFQILLSGVGWQGMPHADNYYSARMREVADGYPLLGNPHFFEHREEIAPAFFVPDVVSALPIVAGLPLSITHLVNFTLWSLVFALLLFALLRRLGLSFAWSAIAAALSYVQMYFQIARPVSMQLVHPVFILFLIAFFVWLENPKRTRAALYLALATALTFYTYQYLWQLVVVFLGLVALYLLLQRDWERLAPYFRAGIYTTLFMVPAGVLTFLQLTHPFYLETMLRVGLGYTHLPSGEVFLMGAHILPLVLLALLSIRWVLPQIAVREKSLLLLLVLFGTALVITSASNVVTGLDLETASHITRLASLWLIIATATALYYLFRARERLFALERWKKLCISLLVLLTFVTNLTYTPDLRGMFGTKEQIVALQDIAGLVPALEWLDEHEQEPIVVWADPRSKLAVYVPIYTKHYVLFEATGMLNLVSDDEVQERYLAASSLSDLTREKIAQDVWYFAGAGYAKDTPNTRNRSVKYCRMLRLELFGYACGELTDSQRLYAPLYAQMWERYISEVLPRLEDTLEKYRVSYVVKDRLRDTDFNPERLKNAELVYQDERVLLYRLN